MDGVTLQKASLTDIPAISSLAAKIWQQHYTSIIGPEQIRFMLEKMYNKESLTEQMEKKSHVFYLVKLHEKNLGFVSVNRVESNAWFLNKFYIDQTQASKGIGTKVYRDIIELIRPDTITLTVNRQNFKAINFYFKNGFRIKEVADFDIGGGYFMNDFVMEAQLVGKL